MRVWCYSLVINTQDGWLMNYKEDDFLHFVHLLSSIRQIHNYTTEKQVLEVVMKVEFGL